MDHRFPLAAVALLVACTAAHAADAARRPNVLVIVGDDMGYGDVGVHGCREIPTPHIDSIARAGVRCTSGYVTGPYCSPTRAALLTGRYQQRFGHEFNPGPNPATKAKPGLSTTETTMAQRLRAAGYRTALVGKWHLGNAEEFHPLNRGFDEFYGFLGGAHSYFPAQAPRNSIVRGREPVEEKEYFTDALAREAVAFVDRQKASPFFLYLAFNAVHTPMHAPPKYLERFGNIADEKRRTYAAMMSAMDDAIGSVLAKVREAGMEQDTLVFFVSDNGGPPANASNNGPLRGHKASTWEGGVRVPFLVQWKGRLPAGKVYDAPVAQIDILPTALAAAGVGVKPEWKLDGADLLPHLTGATTSPPHGMIYWRFGNQMAIRAGDWKLVRARTNAAGGAARRGQIAPTQLFNLAADIGEQNDLAAKHPEKVKELEAAWNKWDAEMQSPAWPAPPGVGQRRRQNAAQQQ